MTGMMHLASFVAGAGYHVAGWRMPDAEFGSEDLDLIIRMVRMWEEAKFDLIFFADALYANPDSHPYRILRLEPLTQLGALAVTTSKIGLVATVSTTYSEPYNVARVLASLDHMSGGRGGWNVVTGQTPEAAANFGAAPHPPHDERYGRAVEYLEVVKGLWDSWEDGAMVGDKESGRYADIERMHMLNHVGPHFSVRGPLNISRPPQGYPVIMQAGGSEQGLKFAADTAEVVFALQNSLEGAIAFSRDLRDRCEAAGRGRDALRILLGIVPVIGESIEDAKAQIAELAALADPAAALRGLSAALGHDLSAHDLDAPMPDLPLSPTVAQGHAISLMQTARQHGMTIRELRDHTTAATGLRLVFGTAGDVADDLERWWRAGACDGYIVQPPYFPKPHEDFCKKVVPILQARGVFRTDYEGNTLREHLGLARPEHPASVMRRNAQDF